MTDLPEGFLGLVPLAVMAGVALWLTASRTGRSREPSDVRNLLILAGVAIAVQSAHFAEEWVTGFHERFPVFLGREPWSLGFFATLNLTWIVAWVLMLPLIARQVRWALFPIWFLGVGCAVNGVAHPLLALMEGRYFPGLWSSPVSGVMGVLLIARILRFTDGGSGEPPLAPAGSTFAP